MVTGKRRKKMVAKTSKPTIKRKKIQFAFYDEDAEAVCVVGDFNGWDEKKHVLQRDGQNIWRKTVMLPMGIYEYRFKVDERWENDPQNDNSCINSFGTRNNILQVS
jgi:1,4-alpha-glucan branching enzyme